MFWYPRWFHIKLSKYPFVVWPQRDFSSQAAEQGAQRQKCLSPARTNSIWMLLPLLPLNFHGFHLEEKSPTVAKCKILTVTHTSKDCKKILLPKLNKAAVLLQEYKRTFHGYNPADPPHTDIFPEVWYLGRWNTTEFFIFFKAMNLSCNQAVLVPLSPSAKFQIRINSRLELMKWLRFLIMTVLYVFQIQRKVEPKNHNCVEHRWAESQVKQNGLESWRLRSRRTNASICSNLN